METLLLNRLLTFTYLLLTDHWYPFHIPSLELCIPFNCCEYTVFKTEHFLDFLTAIKCICWPIWAFLQTEIQISLLFHILLLEKSLPFHIP